MERPRRWTAQEFTKFGLEIIDTDKSTDWLRCRACGQAFQSMIRSGKRPDGWWQCPNGCNAGNLE